MASAPFPSAPPPIAPSRLRDIEERLLCADEADAELESGEPGPPAGPPTGPAGPAAGPAAPGDSRWLGEGAALRAALREGSARCRQRDFAAAVGKFCGALEVKEGEKMGWETLGDSQTAKPGLFLRQE